MPRVGFTPEEQSAGGSLYEFPGGLGEIIDAKVVNHMIPNSSYGANCGIRLTIAPLDAKGKATGADATEEFLAAGKVEKFHPGKGAAQDFGDKGDLGEDDGAEGEFLLCADRGPSKSAKLSIFGSSLIAAGVKPALLDGTAANLIGLKAKFTRFMMEKPKNSTKDEPPTCLIVGTAGFPTGNDLVLQFPKAQSGSSNGTAKKAAAEAKSANKAKEPEADEAPAPAAEASGADEIAGKAIAVLQAIGQGQQAAKQYSFARGRIAARTNIVCTNLISDGTIEQADVKGIVKLIGQKAWLDRQAVEALDWTVSGDTFTVSKD